MRLRQLLQALGSKEGREYFLQLVGTQPALRPLLPFLRRYISLINWWQHYWQQRFRSIPQGMVLVPVTELETLRQQAGQIPLLEALLEEADAENARLREQVERLMAERTELQIRLLQLNNGKSDAKPISKPNIVIVGGNPQRKQVLERFSDRFQFTPFFSERDKGHNDGHLDRIRAAIKKADAVLIVSEYNGHDKSKVATKACQETGKPYRCVRDLTATQLERALRELLECNPL